MTSHQFSEQDRSSLLQRDMDLGEVSRQWSLLSQGATRVVLDRPCTLGDGIDVLREQDHERYLTAHHRAAAQGRWSKFTPASGAASRMFALQTEKEKQEFCQAIDRLPFATRFKDHLASRGIDPQQHLQSGQLDVIVDCLTAQQGLGYGSLAKGLVEFHDYPGEGQARTAFEEHLIEGSECFAGSDGRATLHFTVSPEHQSRFEEDLDRIRQKHNLNSEVSFSVQHPSTNTVALGQDDELIRDASGQILLRPGGHGALIENLNDFDGDLVMIKNIDNVRHGRDREISRQWLRLLAGYTVVLQDEIFQHLQALERDPAAVAAAHEFATATFCDPIVSATADTEQMRVALTELLQRPLRVCGMVKNTGEPGGGPFWVRGSDGQVTLQIVESSEVDKSDPSQKAIFEQSTHFNPVFIAVSLRDRDGASYDLKQFIDHDRPIITHKPIAGQQATVIEKPGLWNGSMALWNTIFVEVPAGVFTPVKTVLDLLRDEHQPSDAPS